MAINIKDGATDRAVRELSALTGEPITEAVRIAVERRLDYERRRLSTTGRSGLRDIVERGRARRTLDDRAEDELLGWNESGLPA